MTNDNITLPQPGNVIQVDAYKADGVRYRWWQGTVESVDDERIVLITPVGHRVEDIQRGGWYSKYAIRAYFWWDAWYSLLEVYFASGELHQIYININSPVEVEGGMLRFTDHELDVSRVPPDAARLVDEDEFAEAAQRFGYTDEFIAHCYRVARGTISLADGWAAKGMDKQFTGKG